jgi:hypothetical protein
MSILSAFIAVQAKRLRPSSTAYLSSVNFVGSAILAVLAAMHREDGFYLLWGVCAFASAVGLVNVARGRTLTPVGH